MRSSLYHLVVKHHDHKGDHTSFELALISERCGGLHCLWVSLSVTSGHVVLVSSLCAKFHLVATYFHLIVSL